MISVLKLKLLICTLERNHSEIPVGHYNRGIRTQGGKVIVNREAALLLHTSIAITNRSIAVIYSILFCTGVEGPWIPEIIVSFFFTSFVSGT